MCVTSINNTFFQSIIQKFAATPPGAWFFARTAHHLDRLFLKLTRSSRPLVSIVSGLPAMLITTTGAKSNLPRSLHLVFIRDKEDGSRLAVVASNLGQLHNPGWYYNLKAHPLAVCTIDGQTRSYIAHEAYDEEYDRFWQYAVDTYDGYQVYQQRAGKRKLPILVLVPQEIDVL